MLGNSVKLERLLLKNFLPLLATTGLDTIEIDWRNTNKLLTIIVGANGSGKTFLLSEMTPAPSEAVASRSKNLDKIVPGKDGLKELDFLLNSKYRYRCKIVYPATGSTKCFIEKEDIAMGTKTELNPNGNVSSYMEALSVELGFQSSYMNIGYLSDGISNFIAMSQQERNTYISKWLPVIMDFVEAHKNVQKNRNFTKKQIEYTNNEIARIVSGDFTRDLESINSRIVQLEKEYEDIQIKISKAEVHYSNLEDFTSMEISLQINKLKDEFTLLSKEREIVSLFFEMATEYSGEKGQERLNKDIEKLHQNLKVAETLFDESEKRMSELKFRIQEQESSEKSQNEDLTVSLPDIQIALKTFSEELSVLVNTRDIQRKNHTFISSSNMSDIEINSLLTSFEEIKRIHSRISSLVDIHDIREDNWVEKIKLIEIKSNSLISEKQEIEKEIVNIGNRVYNLQNNGLDKNILSFKRKECTPEYCPLVREISKYLNPSSEIKKEENLLNDKMMEKKKIEETLDSESERIFKIRSYLEMAEDINHILYRNRDIISKLPVEIMNKINSGTKDVIADFFQIEAELKSLEESISLDTRISLIKSKIDALQKTETIIRMNERSSKEMENLYKEFSSYSDTRDIHRKEISETRTAVSKLISLRDDMNNYIERKNILNERIVKFNQEKKRVDNNTKQWYVKSHLKDALNKLRQMKITSKETIEGLRLEKESIQSKIVTKDLLEEKRNSLDKDFRVYELLEKIWSPRSGYPALLIKDFLLKIKEKTNQDLEAMWGDSLVIDDFVINESSFTIPVIVKKEGTYRVEDASMCSDGEKATLGVAISLAILEMDIENHPYNVVRLDEIDAKLDDTRRRSFLDVMTQRMEQIGCESCISITHNNEFHNTEANIIIMPGMEIDPIFIHNKTILFKV